MSDNDKFADEKLTDEELDAVAGGNVGQTSADSEFLYEHGLMDDWHGNIPTMFKWETYSAEVDSGWSKAGITCVTKFSGNNLYFKDGKKITHDEAVRIVKENFPKIRNA